MKFYPSTKRLLTVTLPLALVGAIVVFFSASQHTHSQESMADKKTTKLPVIPAGHETAIFSAGCYWCVEAVFQRLDGVDTVTSGFIGGSVSEPTYEAVVEGTTGHAEAVKVVYNPKEISYDKLLNWFWKLHDPTQLNRQGADVGTHYRSGIFYLSEAQKKLATESRTKAQAQFPRPIVTEITKATEFYPAKVSHQDYYRINGTKDRYCRLVIEPKLEKLKLNK